MTETLDPAAPPPAMPIRVEFCGEIYDIAPDREFTIGREADLVIDENPYLHRQFLVLRYEYGMWWLANVGNLLSATVTDPSGQVQSWLAPGAKLPVVFQDLQVMFSAGSTTYDFSLHSDADVFNTSHINTSPGGNTTQDVVHLTSSQRLLVIALAEDVLRSVAPGRGEIPSSADAAKRLGWTLTTFNRKLDNVCEKLDKFGVSGLRGGRGNLATNRRARLVEYAVSTRLVTQEDLPILEEAQRESRRQPARPSGTGPDSTAAIPTSAAAAPHVVPAQRRTGADFAPGRRAPDAG